MSSRSWALPHAPGIWNIYTLPLFFFHRKTSRWKTIKAPCCRFVVKRFNALKCWRAKLCQCFGRGGGKMGFWCLLVFNCKQWEHALTCLRCLCSGLWIDQTHEGKFCTFWMIHQLLTIIHSGPCSCFQRLCRGFAFTTCPWSPYSCRCVYPAAAHSPLSFCCNRAFPLETCQQLLMVFAAKLEDKRISLFFVLFLMRVFFWEQSGRVRVYFWSRSGEF